MFCEQRKLNWLCIGIPLSYIKPASTSVGVILSPNSIYFNGLFVLVMGESEIEREHALIRAAVTAFIYFFDRVVIYTCVKRASKKFFCDGLPSSVLWYQARGRATTPRWLSDLCCVHFIYVVVDSSVWVEFGGEQLLAGWGSESVQQYLLRSSWLFLLSSPHKCCHSLIWCLLCHMQPAQIWTKESCSCNRCCLGVCID